MPSQKLISRLLDRARPPRICKNCREFKHAHADNKCLWDFGTYTLLHACEDCTDGFRRNVYQYYTCRCPLGEALRSKSDADIKEELDGSDSTDW